MLLLVVVGDRRPVFHLHVLSRCVSLHPLECDWAGDAISNASLTSQEKPLWEGGVQTGWENVSAASGAQIITPL